MFAVARIGFHPLSSEAILCIVEANTLQKSIQYVFGFMQCNEAIDKHNFSKTTLLRQE